jgi:hypothetical protein
VLIAVRVYKKDVSLEAIQETLLLENTALKLDVVSSDLCWVHEFNQWRCSLGEFNNLYRDAWKFNDNFFEYLRMSTATFDRLLEKLNDDLSRRETNFRKPIFPEERLVVTVR